MLVPVRLRKPVTLDWLNCLVRPVTELYNLFFQNRNANLYALQNNSQTVFMEAALNDTFDSSARRIYITDGTSSDPLFVYMPPENLSLFLGLQSEAGSTPYPDPQWLFTTAETSFSAYDFIVFLPHGLVYDPQHIRALIDKYRLPSKGHYLLVS